MTPSLEASAFRLPNPGLAVEIRDEGVLLQDAIDRVRQGGGNPNDQRLVQSRIQLQFGKYRGKTFHWVLSNDMGWTCAVLASHKMEREAGDDRQHPAMRHKDALLAYAVQFGEVKTAVWASKLMRGSLIKEDVRYFDDHRVGTGQQARATFRALYESANDEQKS